MKSLNSCLSALILLSGFSVSTSAQVAYSPVIDSIIYLATQSTVGLADRQLSGDTSVLINGVQQTITTRNFQYNAIQNIAAQYIKEKFESYGLEARYQDYSSTGRNILGLKTGTRYPDKKYIICAHYDNMPTALIAPGADDNASGVVAVLEAARTLSPFSSEYTLEFAAWDEEEIGLVGSAAYADSAAGAGMQIMGVLNFDMIAWDSDNDFMMTIGTNELSAGLTLDYEAVMGLYTPEINWNYTDIEASDHASFWDVGYPAILGIEHYPDDFNAFYHTPDDNFSNINLPYFTRMVQASIAGLATLGWNCRMSLQHQVISSGVDTLPQEAALKILTPRTIGSGSNHPRCYYKVNGGDLQFIAPSSINGYIYSFTLPGQPFGTTVSYYFAVQDEDGVIIETLPDGGRGVNPPGTQAPNEFYTYFVSPDQIQTICSATTPKNIPDLSIIYDTIPILFEGGVKDLDVQVNITHTRVKSLNLYLISPDGTQIDLSSGNGGSGSNFTNTIFDDEAITSITSGTAPFTGRYKPEDPLSTFDTKSIYGNWVLKVQDSLVSQVGTLDSWCIIANYYDLSAVSDEVALQPVFRLGQSYPNPARQGLIWIPIELGTRAEIVLELYDLYGRKMKTLTHGIYSEGHHRISCPLDGLIPGTYVYRLQAGSFSDSRFLLLTD